MDMTILDLSNVLPEILEEIFGKMNMTALANCRRACKFWNEEIIRHGKVCIKLDDRNDKAIQFFNRLNLPKSLALVHLAPNNYELLRRHTLAKLKELILTTPFGTSEGGLNVDLRFFSRVCSSLTSLKVMKPVLGSIDFEVECGGETQPYSIFYCLKQLHLVQQDNYDRVCNGNEILLTSKNINFLLQSIGSQSLKSLVVKISNSYYDINCCRARLEHRFETYTLPKFICRQKRLIDLCLCIPSSMPNTIWQHPSYFPTTLKDISISCDRGDTVAIVDDNVMQTITFRPLLAWDMDFYINFDDPIQYHYWNSLLLAQTQIENLCYLTFGHLGFVQDFVTPVLEKNWSTLKKVSIRGKLVGEINCELFQQTENLYELSLCNTLFEEMHFDDEDDCKLSRVIHLPQSLTTINLVNMTLDIMEMLALDQLFNLKRLTYTTNHLYKTKFGEIFGMSTFLNKIVCNHNLSQLILGQFSKDDPYSVQEVVNYYNKCLDRRMYLHIWF